jgi:hypothetical protein
MEMDTKILNRKDILQEEEEEDSEFIIDETHKLKLDKITFGSGLL